jgi:hypothetical protein
MANPIRAGYVGGVKLLSIWSKVGNLNLRFAGDAE